MVRARNACPFYFAYFSSKDCEKAEQLRRINNVKIGNRKPLRGLIFFFQYHFYKQTTPMEFGCRNSFVPHAP